MTCLAWPSSTGLSNRLSVGRAGQGQPGPAQPGPLDIPTLII